jgi:hypothetical protein
MTEGSKNQSLSKNQTTEDRGQRAAKTGASARNRRQTTEGRGQQKPEPQQEPDDRGQRTEAEIAELPKSSPINFPPVADSQDHDLITL